MINHADWKACCLWHYISGNGSYRDLGCVLTNSTSLLFFVFCKYSSITVSNIRELITFYGVICLLCISYLISGWLLLQTIFLLVFFFNFSVSVLQLKLSNEKRKKMFWMPKLDVDCMTCRKYSCTYSFTQSWNFQGIKLL